VNSYFSKGILGSSNGMSTVEHPYVVLYCRNVSP